MDTTDIINFMTKLVRFGTVADIDTQANCARVKYATDENENDVLTDWIRWSTNTANKETTDWNPPAIGEQVAFMTTGTVSFIFARFNQTMFPPAGNSESIRAIKWNDGTSIKYDTETKSLSLTLAAGGELNITGNVNILSGALKINGIDVNTTPHTHNVTGIGSPTGPAVQPV